MRETIVSKANRCADHQVFLFWCAPFPLTGEPVSPLVWSATLQNVLGEPLSHDGLRFVNLTAQYRCHPPHHA